MAKNLLAMQETWARFLGWDDHLEEGMATHTSILTWRIPIDRGAWQDSWGCMSLGQSHLIMVYDHFNILFNLIYCSWGCKELDMTE